MTTPKRFVSAYVTAETASHLRALASARGVGLGRVIDDMVSEAHPGAVELPARRLSPFARERMAPYLATLPAGQYEPCEILLTWAHSEWGDWDTTQTRSDRALAELGYVVGLRGMVRHPPPPDVSPPPDPVASFVATLPHEPFRARDVIADYLASPGAHPGTSARGLGRALRALPGIEAQKDRTGVMVYRRRS